MATSTRIRAGVVGLGSWGMEHLRAWRGIPGVSVVAVCDRDEGLLDRVGESFAVSRRYSSAAQMAADGGLDVVSIVSVEHDRFETATPFFDAGIHAFVEKPLALDLATAERLVAASRRAGVHLMTGHVLRFEPRFVALKQRLAEGALGAVRSVYGRRLNIASAHEKYARTHTALMAQIHDIDLACWFFGEGPTAVRAHELPRDDGEPRLPHVLWTTLEFAAGIAVLEHAWTLPDGGGLWFESETEVLCTDGVARVRTPSDALELVTRAGCERPDPIIASVANTHPSVALKEQLSYFTDCILDGREPERLTVDDGLQALGVALSVVQAAETGESVLVRPTLLDTARQTRLG